MGNATVLILRLFHIIAGVLWVGGVAVVALYIIPSVRALGPAGGAVMNQIGQVRRLPLYLTLLAWVAIFSGLGLYWHNSQGFTNDWAGSANGMVFGIGAVLALAATMIGMMINTPAAKRIGAIAGAAQAEGRPPTPEEVGRIQQLQARLAGGAVLALVLLVLAAAAMAIGRYV